MKYINTITLLNRVIFSITGVLYLTIFLGLYTQVILGVYQVLIAITLLFFIKRMSIKNRNRLTIYWVLVLVYGLFWLEGNFSRYDILSIFVLIIIPLSLAGYFTFILESLKTKKL